MVVTTITSLHALSSFLLPPSYSPGEIPTLDKTELHLLQIWSSVPTYKETQNQVISPYICNLQIQEGWQL